MVCKASEVAKRNDALRAMIPRIAKPGMLVMTRGISVLPAEDIAKIMEKVKTFSEFKEDNDPWGEHDFGSFDYNGKTIFWKIDDYDGHEGIRLLLTVMLASEY